MVIDAMQSSDWEAVSRIYAEGIATGVATFETTVPAWEVWDKSRLPQCRMVARHDQTGEVLGWVALSPYSSRHVYRGVAEHTIYIATAARGQGVGKALLNALITESEKAGFWTLQSGVFVENAASRALHAACGFREVGIRERIGQLHGIWHDVVLIERRSNVIGN